MAPAQTSAEHRTKPDEPYRYGWRYVDDGDTVPLTEDDLLHPREGDFIVNNDHHDSDRAYLKNVFKTRTADRPGIRILADHIIDFQHGDVQPLGPDITALNGEPCEWDGTLSTFPVVDMNARILFVMELTSPSTRRTDLKKKLPLYYRAGVPRYIICDTVYGRSKKPLGILPYQAGPAEFELLPLEANGRFWIDIIDVWLGIENGRVTCYDAEGERIADYEEIVGDLKEEKANAEREKARAEEEKARADAAEARIRELEAMMKRSKPRKK